MCPSSRTPPGVRELKPPRFMLSDETNIRRTPPGVRELKLLTALLINGQEGRTPPGVRELKPQERPPCIRRR